MSPQVHQVKEVVTENYDYSITISIDIIAVPGARLPGSATNGNTNGYHEWLCCHTEKEKQPWWEVDLETVNAK